MYLHTWLFRICLTGGSVSQSHRRMNLLRQHFELRNNFTLLMTGWPDCRSQNVFLCFAFQSRSGWNETVLTFIIYFCLYDVSVLIGSRQFSSRLIRVLSDWLPTCGPHSVDTMSMLSLRDYNVADYNVDIGYNSYGLSTRRQGWCCFIREIKPLRTKRNLTYSNTELQLQTE
jgi:hypothetical protein